MFSYPVYTIYKFHIQWCLYPLMDLWNIINEWMYEKPTLSISLPAFYCHGFQPNLLTRNELWLKYSGNIRCDIQIMKYILQSSFILRCKGSNFIQYFFFSTKNWNIQMFAATELPDSTYCTFPTSVWGRSQQNVVK
jgi:hypothetical protein